MQDDLIGVLGVVLGGRLGYVLFYKPGYYLEHPLESFQVWQGGMSFHGGFLGVLAASWWVARKHNLAYLQLTDFLADPANRGRVLDSGVWAWSRHPNYFGDALLWWGFWLCGVDLGVDGALTVFAPALMTFLLVQVSGVRMLDRHLAATRPGYAEYMERTPGFVPGFRRTPAGQAPV